jgi:hypothetical protein
MLQGLKKAFGFKRPETDLNEKEFSFAKKLFPNQTKQNYHALCLSPSLSIYICVCVCVSYLKTLSAAQNT